MASTTKHQLVSVTEAAVVVAVSTRTARRHVADGHLAAVQLGRKTLRSRSSQSSGSSTPHRSMGGVGKPRDRPANDAQALQATRKGPRSRVSAGQGPFLMLPRLDSNQQPSG